MFSATTTEPETEKTEPRSSPAFPEAMVMRVGGIEEAEGWCLREGELLMWRFPWVVELWMLEVLQLEVVVEVVAGESGSGGRLAVPGGDDAEEPTLALSLVLSALRLPIRSNKDGRARRRSIPRPNIRCNY